jgi:hypothetical protein
VKTVRVEIKGMGRELKVVWHDDSRFPSYFINRKAVEDCAREIRSILRELVDAALNSKLASYGATLKQLAEQGALLHQALFAKTGGEGDPKRIRNYFAQLRDAYRLRFVVSDDVFVPWGLVYPSDASALPNALPENSGKAWEIYRHFWCLDRQLSTLYYRIPPDAAGGGIQDASTLDMIRVVHPDTFANATAPLANCPEHGFLGWLKNFSGDPLTTSRQLKDEWRKKGAQIGLLYFYCHASASKLALGNDEKIEASQLFLMLSDVERQPGSSGCLVLINGCSTAVGAVSGEFLQSTSRQGLCGFVGTETDVPDLFALRFSISLLRLLFHKGMTLGEAMQCLYREHFPLSFVYGLYALPNFRMQKEQAPDIVFKEPQNFSFGQVGTNRLEAYHGA